MSVSLVLVPYLGLFSCSLFALSNFNMMVFVMFSYLLEACSFLMRDKKGVDPEQRRDGERRWED